MIVTLTEAEGHKRISKVVKMNKCPYLVKYYTNRHHTWHQGKIQQATSNDSNSWPWCKVNVKVIFESNIMNLWCNQLDLSFNTSTKFHKIQTHSNRVMSRKSVKPRFNNDCDNLDLVQTVQIVAGPNCHNGLHNM